MEAACAPEQIAAQRWNVLSEDLNLPVAVLSQSRLEHNLAWMQRFVGEYGVKLAPHGKTTMAPRLFQRQLEGGAWGITLATAHQTRVAYAHGVRRVLMANQLVGKRNMAILAELLADPSFEFFCLVDAADQVDQLAAFFGKAGRAAVPVCAMRRNCNRCWMRSRVPMAPSSWRAWKCMKA